MQYCSRRFPFGPVLTLTLVADGLQIELGGPPRLWRWDEIHQVELFVEYRKNQPRRLVCRVYRTDRARVEIVHDPWAESPTRFDPFVRALHRAVAAHHPAATFGTDGSPAAGAAIGAVFVTFGCAAFCWSGCFLTPMGWWFGGGDPLALGIGALAGVAFGLLSGLPFVAMAAVVRHRSRPRSWGPDSIPSDLLG